MTEVQPVPQLLRRYGGEAEYRRHAAVLALEGWRVHHIASPPASRHPLDATLARVLAMCAPGSRPLLVTYTLP